MNRVKLWVFTLLAVGAGATWLYAASGRMVARSIDSIDARLRAAKALTDARTRLLERETAGIAAAATRVPVLVSTLAPARPPPEPSRMRRGMRPPPPPAPPPPGDPMPAAEAAARAAAQSAGFELSRGLLAGLVRDSKLSLRSGGHEVKLQSDAAAAELLETALDERARDALVRVEHTAYYATAFPVAPGIALVVGLPLDSEWAQSIHAATGADVTFVVDEKRTVTTASPSEARALLDAVKKPAPSPMDVGSLGPVKLNAIPTPGIPLLFAKAPGWRAQAMTLPGASEITVVLSRSTRSQLASIAIGQQVALLGLAALLLLGLLLGILVRSESPPPIPRELLAAADRIAHGQFDVRAPVLAGQLGTMADALNRAAEVAARKPEPQPAEAAMPSQAEASFLEPVPLAASGGEARTRDVFAEPERLAEAFAPSAASPAVASEAFGSEPFLGAAQRSAVESAPGGSAEPAPTASPALFELPPAGSPSLLEPPQPAPQPAASLDDADEEHWRQVFEEFLLIRRQCGEPSDGLTFEKFRQKLQKNRDSLVAKYGCKAVRFQAYVKDGKAALKATPVR